MLVTGFWDKDNPWIFLTASQRFNGTYGLDVTKYSHLGIRNLFNCWSFVPARM